MPRWLKYTLAGLAAFFGLAAVALAALVHTIDLDRYARLAIAEVRTATGRELAIRGKLEVSVFPRLAVRAEDVSFANAAWGSRPELVKAKRVDGAVALLPLLRRKIDITRLVVTDLDVLLETDAKGVGNWVFKPPAGVGSPPADSSGAIEFEIAGLDVKGGTIAWRNGASKETLRFAVRRLRLKERLLVDTRDVELDAAFRDQPFTVKGAIGGIGALVAKDSAWPVDLVAATDGAQLAAKGSIDWRGAPPTADLALRAELKQTRGVAKLAGVPLDLPTPAELTATLASGKGEQIADPLRLVLGKSVVDGRIAVKTGGARLFVTARLASKAIDLAAGTASKNGAARRSRVFSEAPFPLESLRALDVEANVAIDRLVLPNRLPIDALRARIALKGGRLEVQPLAASLGGGPVAGRLTLDAARPKAATLALSLDGKGISAERIAAAVGHAGAVTGGSTDVAISLAGPGESLARFMGGANGEIRIAMGPARTSGAALDAGGGAITTILDQANPFRRSDPYTDLRCAVVRLPVREGIATSHRTIAYETSKVNMVMAGTIDFRSEGLDLAVRPSVKEGIGIGASALAELVRVTGTLAEPSVGIDSLGSARAALSVGGAILTGGLSLLGEAAISKATTDPHPCQTALASGAASKAGPQPQQKKEDEGLLGSVRRLFK